MLGEGQIGGFSYSMVSETYQKGQKEVEITATKMMLPLSCHSLHEITGKGIFNSETSSD